MAVTKRVFRQAVRVGSLDGIAFENRAAAKATADMANIVLEQIVAQLGVSESVAEDMIENLDPSTISELLDGAAKLQPAAPVTPTTAQGAPRPINYIERLLAKLKPKSRTEVLAQFYGAKS